MTLLELERQSEELEQTLKMQLGLIKEDSGIYMKVAGIALVSGLATYSAYRLTKGKSSSKKLKKKSKKKKGYSLLSNLKQRLFWMAMDYGKKLFIQKMGEKMQAESEKQ
jgi:hypothetical protein